MKVLSKFNSFLLIVCFVLTSCGVACVQSKKEKVTERLKVYEAEQMITLNVKEGGEYVVKDVVDLRGANVILPANVMITFKKGGAIVNGTLTGNYTRMNSKAENILGVRLKGTWRVDKIHDIAFNREYLSDDDIINNINTIQSDDLNNEVTITRDYTVTIPWSGGPGLKLASNCTLFLNATLTVAPNDYKVYNIVQIKQKQNVKIKGGKIVGDVGRHRYVEGSTSEWGMGVDIEESQDVVLEDLYITKCCGDGIYISGGNEPSIGVYNHASRNVTIRNVTCDDNRRQGLSVIHVDGLIVRNCSFVNTGKTEFTAPGAGIDIEPNVKNERNQSVKNVVIDNCIIKNNKGMAVANSVSYEFDGKVNHENILYSNCSTDGLLKCASADVTFRNCSFKEAIISSLYTASHIVFENSTIAGGYGVMINTPSVSGTENINRKLSLIFRGCMLSSDNGTDETNALIGCIKPYHVQNIEKVVFDECRLELLSSEYESRSLTSTSFKDKLVIKSSEIQMPGIDFDANGIQMNKNTIRCRRAKGLPANSKDKVIIE